jgi:hypothetical protein
MRSLAVLGLVVLLSGCTASSSKGTATAGEFDGLQVSVSATTGAIRGIVVDQAIKPIAKATVALNNGNTNKTATTDDQGRFTFSDLPAGTYFLAVKHLLYKATQQSVDVKAGIADPPITKVQLEALFSGKPYHDQVKFKGIIACGYQAPIITATCIVDYSTIVCAGGCVPQAHDTLNHAEGDNRAFDTSVGPGWQTIVTELVFQSNGQGTTDRMGVLMSFHNRTASDWFGTAEGLSPVLLRLETGVVGPSQQGKPDMIAPEGRNDLLILASIKDSEGQQTGFGVNQEFQVFQSSFYNAKPAEGWSFAKGDEFPF